MGSYYFHVTEMLYIYSNYCFLTSPIRSHSFLATPLSSLNLFIKSDFLLSLLVTILLLSLYATGNDSCHLRKQAFGFTFVQRRNVLSLQIVRNWLACID